MRSALEVLDDHLRRREGGDLEGDLETNYAPNVILLCEHGAFEGRKAIRESAEALSEQLPEATFEYRLKLARDDYAFILWRADSSAARAEHGVDSFVIRDGRIVMQTIAYELQPK
jgi:hypothetical protein